MMWVRLDCAAPHHHKLLLAGAEAAWLWVAGLCYSNLHTTNGVIFASALSALYPTTDWTLRRMLKLSDRLVEVGLWHTRDGGWEIHGYVEFQHPALRAEVERRKEYEREKKRAQRAKKSALSVKSSPNDVESASQKSVDSSSLSASVPKVSPGDVQAMSPGDKQKESHEDTAIVSQELARVASRRSGPSRSEPIRTVPSQGETRARNLGAYGETSAQSAERVKELIEVLRERCPTALLFAGAETPAILNALDQRLSEIAGRLDRSRFEQLALWYAGGAMAWRKTPLGLRELSAKEGMLAEHFESAAKWDREGRRSLRTASHSTVDCTSPPSHEGEASAGDPLLAKARLRRGPQGDHQ